MRIRIFDILFVALVVALVVALIGGGIALLYGRGELERLRAENHQLRAEAERVTQLTGEIQDLRRAQADVDELERLRKQTQEIHKLRAQYQESQELRQQYAALLRENEQLKADNQQLTGQQQALRAQFQSVVAAAGANRPNTPAATVPAAWLGVSIQTLAQSPEAQSQNPGVTDGVVVAAVVPDTPAESSGLQVGDIVTAIDDQPVASAAGLRDAMATKQVGQRVVVDVMRGGLVHKIGVNAAPYPQQ
jgi:C-terminal processing protease CtpA/Prc